MKNRIKYIIKCFISNIKFMKYFDKKNNPNAIAAELIRYTHSMEKGLSIENIRYGFGHKKQEQMIGDICVLKKYDLPYYNEVIDMAISSLSSYIEFHDDNNYSDDFLLYLKDFVSENNNYKKETYGGVIEFDYSQLKFDEKKIEEFFNSRHSIRNFSKKSVNESLIKKAVILAQRAPSACNRQGVRVYVVDKSRSSLIVSSLKGIGGFSDSIDKLIIITGKLSSYSFDECNQYIVSASIYAAYLTLTLHLYGLGSCIIQRPVIWNKKMEKVKKEYDISDDEQIICMLGVGNVDGKVNVPISHRINIDEFYKYIE